MPHDLILFSLVSNIATSTNCGDEATLSLVCYPEVWTELFRTPAHHFSQQQPEKICLMSSSQLGPLRCTPVLPERLSRVVFGQLEKAPTVAPVPAVPASVDAY